MYIKSLQSLSVSLLICSALVACHRGEEHDKQPSAEAGTPAQAANPLALKPDEMAAAGITTAAAAEQVAQEQLMLTGNLTANQDRLAKVNPRLPGRLVTVTATQGQSVRPGQILAVIESVELGEARASFQQARSDAMVADAALKRAESLASDDIIPQKELWRARGDAQRAQAALRAASGKLQMFGVASNDAPGASYPLIAPFAGTVIDKKAVVGELVQPDQSLFAIADLSTVWLEADVYEKDLAKVAVGGPASVHVAAYPDAAYAGRLAYLASVMDPTSRTVKARIEISNPSGQLRPGMFATVTLGATTTAKALRLPAEAVVLMQGRPTVFVQGKEGFIPRTVETGPTAGGQVAITAGLAAGEQVAVTGTYALKARVLKTRLGGED